MDFGRMNSGQIEAVKHIKGPCRVIAGAGSGKTMVLTHRIQYLIEKGVSPNNILAITFTKKAATEMKERLIKLIGQSGKNVFLGTFHSFGFRLIANERKNKLKIIDEFSQHQIIRKIISKSSSVLKEPITIEMDENVVLGFISWQKNHLILPTDKLDMTYFSQKEDQDEEESYQKVYVAYEQIKKQENLLDFDDMLIECYSLLKKDSKIRKKYQSIYKYILVDEFQDTNVAQYKLISLLAGDSKNVFIVGDARQAIYSWRASNVNFILNFDKEWTNSKTVSLDDNYRSTMEIVDLSTSLIKHSSINYPGLCRSGKGNSNGLAKYIFSENEQEEAENIVNIILDLKEKNLNLKYSDIAILYRLNMQSRPFEDLFIKNNIPYYVNGSPGFYGRKEIQEILCYLKLLLNPNDLDSFKKIVNVPNRGLDKNFINNIEEVSMFYNLDLIDSLSTFWNRNKSKSQSILDLYLTFDQLLNFISEEHTVDEIIIFLRELINYDSFLEKRTKDTVDNPDETSKIDILNSFTESCKRFKNIQELFEYIYKIEEQKQNKSDDKIQLMTLHRSKGLEFNTVFMVGLVNGLLPHQKSCLYDNKNQLIKESIEEERRLAYVGITRAKETLFLSTFDNYGKKRCETSVFLKDIESELETYTCIKQDNKKQ